MLPLIDFVIMGQWRNDLEAADIQEILGRVPKETQQSMGKLHQAISRSDIGMVRRAAHRLKGMAASLGAARLAHEARCIEMADCSIADFAAPVDALERTLRATLAALDSTP